MKIILNDSNSNIGGVETFLEDLASLLSVEHDVFFLVDNHESYYEKNDLEKKYRYIYKNNTTLVEYLNERDLKVEIDYIHAQLDMDDEYFVISFYFSTLQYAMATFGDRTNFKLLHFWSHPQSWINSLALMGRRKFVDSKTIINKKKYNYQRDLLNKINEKRADFCGLNKTLLEFNNWFYDINLTLNPNSFGFPTFSKCIETTKTFEFRESRILKVLWVGRFDWFKNKSIEYIVRSLEYINNQQMNVTLILDIIGYGSERYLKEVTCLVKHSDLNINILQAVEYDCLPELFRQYDLGIAMGLTVKNMADCFLPAILIDSIDKVDIFHPACDWLYNSDVDDSGDGYYSSIFGHKNKKKTIIDLINPIIEEEIDLKEISIRNKSFFDENYSMQNNLTRIIFLLENSGFSGLNFRIYRRPLLIRLIYMLLKKLIGRHKASFLKFVNSIF